MMPKKQLFDILILEIEAGDLKAIQRRLGIKSINFSLDKKITLAPDKAPMLSMSDQLGNTLLLTAANFQQHNLVDL